MRRLKNPVKPSQLNSPPGGDLRLSFSNRQAYLPEVKGFIEHPPCSNCGQPATCEREVWDACPTDRGTEYRYYVEALCDECLSEAEIK